MSRYEVDPDEDYQPGSTEVLRNYLNTVDPNDVAEEESALYVEASKYFTEELSDSDPITVDLIIELHRYWLGRLYPSAGKIRSVSMSKGGWPFAAPDQLERLLNDFEKNELKKYTPCKPGANEKVAEALAVVHAEFILIHPFREGNGRVGRLISYLMGLQAGLPPLNFESIEDDNPKGFAKYIAAIQKSMDRDYGLMIEVFLRIIEDSLD